VKLLFASRNRGKAAEVSRLLEGSGWRVVTLSGIGVDVDLVENGLTFEENARMKAHQAAQMFKMWTLADDSGLEVDALGGEPGVCSARYAGPDATDADRIKLLLDRLIAVPDGRRTARFRCVVCLVDPTGEEKLFDGKVDGTLAHHARGTAGFGYDPVFIPDGWSRTFAELGLEVKNRLSHRAVAMRAVVAYLRTKVQTAPPGAKQAGEGPGTAAGGSEQPLNIQS
jgi:XTP/dITP diphosphohydrolase